MSWVRRNLVGLAAVVLAVVTLLVGASGLVYRVQRDEQIRGAAIREARGELDLAGQHRKGAALLGDLAGALQAIALSAAALTAVVAAWGANRSGATQVPSAVAFIIALVGVVLGLDIWG